MDSILTKLILLLIVVATVIAVVTSVVLGLQDDWPGAARVIICLGVSSSASVVVLLINRAFGKR